MTVDLERFRSRAPRAPSGQAPWPTKVRRVVVAGDRFRPQRAPAGKSAAWGHRSCGVSTSAFRPRPVRLGCDCSTVPEVPAKLTPPSPSTARTAYGHCIGGAFLAFAAVALPARAQQQTFHLDRLEVPGAPDDGVVIFRPVTEERPTFYAQLALGFSLDPLRTSDITKNEAAQHASAPDVVTTQLSTYLSAGFELFDRMTVGATFPAAWIETGNQPNYPVGVFGGNTAPTAFSTTGPALGDTRFDLRFVVWRSDVAALGAQVSVFVPTGAGSSMNFGGDGSQLEWMPMVSGEWTPRRFPLPLTFVANTGFDFRHDNSINDPVGYGGLPSGLGIGDEWRWAVEP